MQTAALKIGRKERLTLLLLAGLSLSLRTIAFFRYRFDSDEPQHLHVTWAWTAGLLPYRDVFDNHTPLFHMLSAPLLALLGERADILLWMRGPMMVLFFAVVVFTFLLARRLFDTPTASWSVLLLSLFPPFFLKSLEYRNDNLWTALCVAAVLVLFWQPAITLLRAATASLLLGLAVAVSLKTGALVVALSVVGVLVAVLGSYPRRRAAAVGVVSAVAFALPPLAIAAYFASHGAFQAMLDGVFRFNNVPLPHPVLSYAGYAASLLIFGYFAARRQRSVDPSVDARPFILTATVLVFTFTVVAFFPLISLRHFLAVMPLMAIGFVRAVRRLTPRTFAAVSCVFALGYYADGFENRTDEHITMMNQVLRLTRPGEPLMDMKGETIYRRRPYYPILEIITREKIRRGEIADTIPEAIVRWQCHVAQADGPPWPPRGRAFMQAHFLDLGRLRAAGQWIEPDGRFSIAIPGDYILLDEWGEAPGTLDGTPQSGPRRLEAGEHRFIRAREKRVACLWAPAFARGFSPFHLRDRDF